jgi:hypothetical protein
MQTQSKRIRVPAWTAVLLLSCAAGNTAAETTTIDRVPYRISSSGSYDFAGDLRFEQLRGPAISVEANDVEIDLNGFTLSGTVNTNTLAIGIQGNHCSQVTIKNGRISGFYFGIDLRAPADNSTHGNVISDLILSHSQYFGMRIVGRDSKVQRCTVIDTGGSTRPAHTIPHAVRLVGARNVMRDCRVIDMRLKRFDDGKGEVVGVHFDAAKDAVFEDNFLVELQTETDDLSPADDTKERMFGIWINGGLRNDTFVTVRNNTFVGFTVPVVFSPGSDGRAVDNKFYDAAQKPVRGKPALRQAGM